MIIFILLLGLSFACFFILGHRVSQKIPQLAAVPDQVITARFEEDSARIRLLILNVRAFYRDGKFKALFWDYTEKAFRRLHITLMRLDNLVVSILERVKKNNGARNGMANGALPQANIDPISERTNVFPAPQRRIDEIRPKK